MSDNTVPINWEQFVPKRIDWLALSDDSGDMDATISNPNEWLKQEYIKRRRKNPQYSLRAFARFLAISPGRLSELLSEKRHITTNIALRFAEKLALPPDSRSKLLNLIRMANSLKQINEPEVEPTEFESLSGDAFSAIAEWYHFAIFCLFETDDFKPEIRWLAKRLGISTTEARDALERLERLGLLTKDGTFWRKTSKKGITTSHDIESAALRRAHRESLERAITSLEDIPVLRRDITSITMAIDVEKLPQAKELIKKFRRQLCRFLETGKKLEVYELNIQLVPISKRSESI